MNCSAVRDMLEPYIADDLSDAESARVAEHLGGTEIGFCRMMTQEILKFTEAEVRDYCTMMMETISEKDLQKISYPKPVGQV